MVLAAAVIGVFVAIWLSASWLTNAHRMQAQANVHLAARCEDAPACAAQALRIQARELVTTEAMLDLAFVQVVFSFAGLIGLGGTFFYAHRAWFEAKRSADAALKAFEADNRAWVTVRPVEIEAVTWSGDTPRITLTLEAENVGPQPAFDVCVGLDTFTGIGVSAGQRQADSLRDREVHFNRSGSEIGTALISGETRRFTFSGPAFRTLPPPDDAVNLEGESARDWDHLRPRTISGVCCVTYRSPSIEATHASTCILWIVGKDKSFLRPEDGDVSGDNLRVSFFGSRMS